jgi:DNA topoisomerase-1
MASKNLPIETFSPEELARLAGLRYVTDEQTGFTRERNGNCFYYCNGRGLRVRERRNVARIEALTIPPAWTDVWICRFAEGHVQATGRDDRLRKQYIYHERWREISNLAKFWRLRQCPQFLPELRRCVARDLRARGLTRNRVLAGMVAILDLTSIRIGNEEYVRQNNSYGLATLRTRHVTINGAQAKLQFRAKGGAKREAVIEDRRLVRLLKELRQLSGAHVFQYVDNERNRHRADAITVNDYLRERTSHPFSAKDFRTWKASALAAGMLYEQRDVEKPAARKRIAKTAVSAVAEALGNTLNICRKYYVHSGLLEAYLDGQMLNLFQRYRRRPLKGLSHDEQILAYFLRRWPPRR